MGFEMDKNVDMIAVARVAELARGVSECLGEVPLRMYIDLGFDTVVSDIANILVGVAGAYAAPGYRLHLTDSYISLKDDEGEIACYIDYYSGWHITSCDGAPWFADPKRLEEILMRYADAVYTLLIVLIERAGDTELGRWLDNFTSAAVKLVELGAKMDPDLYDLLSRLFDLLKTRVYTISTRMPRIYTWNYVCGDTIGDTRIRFLHDPLDAYYMMIEPGDIPWIMLIIKYRQKDNLAYIAVRSSTTSNYITSVNSIDLGKLEAVFDRWREYVSSLLKSIRRGDNCPEVARVWLDILNSVDKQIAEVP